MDTSTQLPDAVPSLSQEVSMYGENRDTSSTFLDKKRRSSGQKRKGGLALPDLLKRARDNFQKLESAEPIDQEYLGVPCPRCGLQTVGDGQVPRATRRCKECRAHFSMDSWAERVMEGTTPLKHFLGRIMHPRKSPGAAGASANTTLDPDMQVPDYKDPGMQTASSVPGSTASQLEIKDAEESRNVSQLIAMLREEKEEDTEETRRQAQASEGLRKICALALTDPSATAFLAFLRSPICTHALSSILSKYMAEVQKKEGKSRAISYGKSYLFIRNEVRDVIAAAQAGAYAPAAEKAAQSIKKQTATSESPDSAEHVASASPSVLARCEYLERQVKHLTSCVEVLDERMKKQEESVDQKAAQTQPTQVRTAEAEPVQAQAAAVSNPEGAPAAGAAAPVAAKPTTTKPANAPKATARPKPTPKPKATTNPAALANPAAAPKKPKQEVGGEKEQPKKKSPAKKKPAAPIKKEEPNSPAKTAAGKKGAEPTGAEPAKE